MEWMCRSNDGITVRFGYYSSTYTIVAGAGMTLTRSARMEETSMNEIKSRKQYSKLISIEHAGMNEADRHFEDLECLNTINIQYSEILSNVTLRG